MLTHGPVIVAVIVALCWTWGWHDAQLTDRECIHKSSRPELCNH